MKILKYILTCLAACLALASCSRNSNTAAGNSIYYWRTTFTLNPAERDFLRQHDIKKIYIRFFDVDVSYDTGSDENVAPLATIRFIDSIPEGIDVIPTVYITHSAISQMLTYEDKYAEKVYKRVKAICRKHNIKFNEIQLDCDWTKGTRQPFFRLCEQMKAQMDSIQTLSSTIRLHQLTQSPPPVDKGVLMVYNTGKLTEITTDNSIFSPKDIEPYLRDDRLRNYPLTLDVAYPAYGWSLVFDHRGDEYKFDRIVRRTDFSDSESVQEAGHNLYQVTSTINLSDDPYSYDRIYSGELIKVERPTAKDIIQVKKMIDAQLKGKGHGNILYHLDETQLSNYSDNEISKIYTCH